MTYLKKFTDFCAGFAAFAAMIYLFRKFMSFNPSSTDSKLEKLKDFFARDNYSDYRGYLYLFLLLALSLAISVLFSKYPAITLAFSVLPLIQVLTMYSNNKLYERPNLFLTLVFVNVAGNFGEAIFLDRKDGKKRAYAAANLFSLLVPLYCLAVYLKIDKLKPLDSTAVKELGKFDKFIYENLPYISKEMLLKVIIAFLLTVILSLALRKLYYIDFFVSLVPLVYFVYIWEKDELYLHPMFIITLVFVNALARLVVFLSEPTAAPRRLQRTQQKTEIPS